MKYYTIGTLLIMAYIGYEVWRGVKTKNYGRFDKTSMLVWGGVILLAAVTAGFLMTIG